MPVLGGAGIASQYPQGDEATIVDRPRPVVNVMDYGAVGDGQIFGDGVTTNGSATFTSATANFTADDVGKLIVITQGSASQVTTIQARVSATQITLAATCTLASGTSRPFAVGTDNTTAIAAAVADLGNTTNGVLAQTLYFPASEGAYLDQGTHDFSNTKDITVLGDSSYNWLPHAGIGSTVAITRPSDWWYTGGGSSTFLNATGSYGFRVIGMGIRTMHAAYSGLLIDLHTADPDANLCVLAEIRDCLIGEIINYNWTAKGVDVRGIVHCTFDHVMFKGLKYQIKAEDGTQGFSNVVTLRKCIFGDHGTASVYIVAGALPIQWLFDSCTFEPSPLSAPSILTSSGGTFTFVNTGFWDRVCDSGGAIVQSAGTLRAWAFLGCFFEFDSSGFAFAFGTIDGLSVIGCHMSKQPGGANGTVFKTGMTATNFAYQGNAHTLVTDNSGVTAGSLST